MAIAVAAEVDFVRHNADPSLKSQTTHLERFELITRSTCREMFAEIMEPERIKHNLSRQVIRDLEEVLFTVVYPTPPLKDDCCEGAEGGQSCLDSESSRIWHFSTTRASTSS